MLDQNIYKVGKTKRPFIQRFKEYPKGSEVVFVIKVIEIDTLERTIINKFRGKFMRKDELGAEYFEGSMTAMIDIIYQSAVEQRTAHAQTTQTTPTETKERKQSPPPSAPPAELDILDLILNNAPKTPDECEDISNIITTDGKYDKPDNGVCTDCSYVINGVKKALYNCGIGKIMVNENTSQDCICSIKK